MVLAFLLVFSAQAAVEYGIAQNYPKDVGIKNDPAVIFTEDFEESSLSQMQSQWEAVAYPGNQTFTSDIPSLSGGTHSLYMSSNANLYRRILPGYDQVYLRFYAKIGKTCMHARTAITGETLLRCR
jgi:hypothetical protein